METDDTIDILSEILFYAPNPLIKYSKRNFHWLTQGMVKLHLSDADPPGCKN